MNGIIEILQQIAAINDNGAMQIEAIIF